MAAQLKVKLAEGWCDMGFGSKSETVEAQPGGGSSGGSSAMGKLLSGMQSAGVDMSGGSSPSEETKKKLRELGIEVYKKGGKVKSASARADGIAIRGKTRA
jgi:hypothetical protein